MAATLIVAAAGVCRADAASPVGGCRYNVFLETDAVKNQRHKEVTVSAVLRFPQ